MIVLRQRLKKVEESLLTFYENTRNAYSNKLAVVQVERNACGGCFSSIPPQTRLELVMRQKIIYCEHCGRVLVDSQIETPLEELKSAQE